MKTSRLDAGTCLVWLAMCTPLVQAQTALDRYWPCEQALVPSIAAAVIWDGPSIEAIGTDWRDDAEIARLAHQISSPRVPVEEGELSIERFADQLQPASKDTRLTLLFAGTLELLNRDRAGLIHGIKRFSRGQADRAGHLSRLLDEMLSLEDDAGDAARQRLVAIQQTIEIQQRMFDERESSIQFLCTRPVAVEGKLGRLARAIAAHLD